MMAFEHAVEDPASPSSPPGMSVSKSSKSSSFHSLEPEDNSVLADVGHFEEIGLDDEPDFGTHYLSDQVLKTAPNPYSPSFSSDLRAASIKQTPVAAPRPRTSRELSKARGKREFASRVQNRPPFPSLKSQVRNVSAGPQTNGSLLAEPKTCPLSSGQHDNRSLKPHHLARHRSQSPNTHLGPKHPSALIRPRRSSWQSNRERKSALQLELECDEDDCDDIPDGLVLDNVPISPRPPQERPNSQPCSKATSPERPAKKDRVRSVGNGTPAVAVAQGSLRSPTWKADSVASSLRSAPSSSATSPVDSRAKSWTAALADLNTEVKILTEKLEEHADHVDLKMQRSSTGSIPLAKSQDTKPRVKSALAELPPLRRTNVMIDPLPISKEKEAVLSRTRPSWLPPKNPAEERRHLKEYQKMMVQSLEAERRREAAKRARSECRDTAADSLMHLWEDDILPRWNDAIRERRTRELWWRGIAPRSRGPVWSMAIGNELGLTEKSWEAALGRAREAHARIRGGLSATDDARHAAWFAAIDKDVEEHTWRDLRIFQVGGPLHESLVDVLRSYAMYRSDIGYVPGCNTIAALLLLNLPSPHDAFVALANLLNRPLPLSFYVSDAGAKSSAYNLLLQTLQRKSPELHDHLVRLPDHDPDSYLGDVLTALFTTHIALDEASRLWDVYVFEGDAVMVRAGVAFLLEKEMALLGTKTIDDVKEVLNQELHGSQALRLLGGNGQEDRWMQAVRNAGKS